MTNVSVLKKSVLVNGLVKFYNLISIKQAASGEFIEGMTLPEVAEFLDVSRSAIQQHITKNNLSLVSVTTQTSQELRKLGVISLEGRTPNFLPKDTVEKLIAHFVHTEAAKAIRDQLFEVSNSVREGDIAAAQALVGVTAPVITSQDEEAEMAAMGLKYIAYLQKKADVAEQNLADEKAAHHLTIVTSLIGKEQVKQLERALRQTTVRYLAEYKGEDFIMVRGTLQNMVKARWGRPTKRANYKELDKGVFEGALKWLDQLPPKNIHTARAYKNTNESLAALKAVLEKLG